MRDFNATNFESYDLGNNDNLSITGNQITIAGFATIVTAVSGGARLLSKRTSAGGSDVYALYVNNANQLRFRLNGTDLNQANFVFANQLYHFAATYDGSTKKLFINGNLNNSTSTTLTINNSTANTFIGERAGESRNWYGKAGHIGLWNAAVPDAEIFALSRGRSPLTVRRTNLVGYWPLDGNSTEREQDLSGNNNHGIATQPDGPDAIPDMFPVQRVPQYALSQRFGFAVPPVAAMGTPRTFATVIG